MPFYAGDQSRSKSLNVPQADNSYEIPQDQFLNDNFSDYLRNDSRQLLQSLSQHDQLIHHLSVIVTLLELDQISWDYTEYLWKNSADTLRNAWPQLYQIPQDIAVIVQQLRAIPGWGDVQQWCIAKIKHGVLSSCRPKSRHSSLSSHQSSIRSINSTKSNLSRVSSVTSQDSAGSSSFGVNEKPNVPCTPVNVVPSDHLGIYPASYGSAATTPAALIVRSRDEKPYKCPLEGCGKLYVYEKGLGNHMLTTHPTMMTLQPSQENIPPPLPKKPWQKPSWTTQCIAATKTPTISQNKRQEIDLEEPCGYVQSSGSGWQGTAMSHNQSSLVHSSQMTGSASRMLTGDTVGNIYSSDIAMFNVGNSLPPNIDIREIPPDWGENSAEMRFGG